MMPLRRVVQIVLERLAHGGYELKTEIDQHNRTHCSTP
jgi:hypothetical protein